MRESNSQIPDMQSPSSTDSRIAEFAKLAEIKGDIASLQMHLREVIEGVAFKGSHRSGQFLQYIVDQAIAGHFESLKERVIGVELFGRSASYDTGDDAIVRVTASDVRKRLLQHYGKYGSTSEFRISLPSGSYIPEITHSPVGEATKLNESAAIRAATLKPDAAATPPQEVLPIPADLVASSPSLPHLDPHPPRTFRSVRWVAAGIVLVALNLALWGISWSRLSRNGPVPVSVLPWSAIFGSSHAIELITSDPNIAEIQGITDTQVSVSDYANHNYIPVPNKLTPEENYFCRTVLRGDNSAGVDAPIVAKVAALAQTNSKSIAVRAARSVQLTDLKSDDDFIFLGSPRSDPWFSLFSDQLDFQFEFDKGSRSEFIRNLHPRAGEQPLYVPTAPGWATGDSYSTIALVKNATKADKSSFLQGRTQRVPKLRENL